MTEIKVRLSFEVPGATLMSSQECDENPKQNYNHQKLMVELPAKKKWQKPKTEMLNIVTRKARPAKQSISISKEAYYYMTSKAGRPDVASVKVSQRTWDSMKVKDRLDLHMRLIAEGLGGSKYHYEVFDD